MTPEQEKILLNKGPGIEEGMAQASLIGAYLWPDGIVCYDLDQRLSKSEYRMNDHYNNHILST